MVSHQQHHHYHPGSTYSQTISTSFTSPAYSAWCLLFLPPSYISRIIKFLSTITTAHPMLPFQNHHKLKTNTHPHRHARHPTPHTNTPFQPLPFHSMSFTKSRVHKSLKLEMTESNTYLISTTATNAHDGWAGGGMGNGPPPFTPPRPSYYLLQTRTLHRGFSTRTEAWGTY